MKKSIIYSLMAVMVLVLSCQNEAEFNIDHLQSPLKAKFEANKTRVFIDEEVQFTNNSIGAKAYDWTFEGGTPSTSSDESPVVTYASEGTYKVVLTVKDGAKQSVFEQESYITVYGDECWQNMVMPDINFKNTASDKSLYEQIVPDPEKLIHTACFDVARWLFICPDEMDALQTIDYTVEDRDGISAKGGQAPRINIFFSATYLQSCKDKGMTDAQLLDEVKGVLYHEVTHGYQFSPQGAGEYKPGDDFYGFIEGMADYVRYVSGYLTTSDRAQGGHWNDGYKTSGFFIDWLHSKDVNFLNKFNHSAKTISPWSWEAATQSIVGKSVQTLWNEYQDDMKTGKIAEIDEKLAKMRNGEEVDFGGGEDNGGGTSFVDITNIECTISTNTEVQIPERESVDNLIDNNPGSKFLAFTNATWAQFSFNYSSVLTKYTLTSGNDAPERDPKNWSLKASNDGTTWVEIDKRTGESFADRKVTNEYSFENATAYKMYKFEFENTSGDIFQLAEVELFATVGSDVNVGDASLVDITNDNPIVTHQTEEFKFQDWGLPENAYDNDPSTPFFNMNDHTWFAFETQKKYNVTKLAITATRNILDIEYVFTPDEFVLLGSNDGTTWTEIHSVANTGIVSFEERKEFKFENPNFYKFHKLTMSAVIEEGTNKRIMIGELELYGTPE